MLTGVYIVTRICPKRGPLLSALFLLAAGCGSETESPTAPAAAPQLAASSAVLHFRQISGGLFHTCGVATDDRAYCWGQNVYGQLGDGTTTSRARPTPVTGNLTFILVSAGDGIQLRHHYPESRVLLGAEHIRPAGRCHDHRSPETGRRSRWKAIQPGAVGLLSHLRGGPV